MSPSEYDLERARIEETYPKGATLTALKDQALADLFHRCRWTQEQLAQKEGKSQHYISYRLRFGRFLKFITGSDKSKEPWNLIKKDLSEWKFRGFWEQTDKELDERFRFREVYRMLEEHITIKSAPSKVTPKQIIEHFGDSKWHTVDTIAKKFDASIEEVKRKLIEMGGGKYKAVCENRKYGTTKQYRIIRGGGKKLDLATVMEEIRPILQRLEEQGKSNMATMSPPIVLGLTHELMKTLERLAR